MNNITKQFYSNNLNNLIFFSIFGIILIVSIFFFSISYRVSSLFYLVPFILLILFNIEKNYLYLLISSLFVGTYFYWPLRIQLINITVYVIFVLFLLKINTGFFNNFKIPKAAKISSVLFVFAVFLSSINSPGQKMFSIYLFFLFLSFMFSGFIVFKSVKDELTVEKFFNYFFICMGLSSLSAIIETVLTSTLRSKGIMGWPIMDFSAITSTLLILKYFVLGTTNIKNTLITIFTFAVLIISLSRFAWIGFVASLIYGFILAYKYDYFGDPALRKRYIKIAIGSIFLIFIGLLFGIHNLILARFSDVTFNFFEQAAEDQYFQNSLETRILIWFTAIQAFQSHPVTGIGYQMFAVISEQYNILPPLIYELFVQDMDTHNTMLSFLAETGILGFCSYIFFIFAVFTYSFKSIKISGSKEEKANSIILHVTIFFIIFNSIYSGQYILGQQAFFMYMFSGLCIGNYVLLMKKNSITGPAI